MTLLRLADAV